MTAPLARTRTILGHPLTVRVTHWINAIAILIMIGSGWRIWNSSPIFDFHFPVDITLGGDVELSQDVHNETGLAGALEWHFAAMWLLVVNGLVYFLYGIVCGHLRRTMFPVGPSAFVRDAWAALQFRLPHRPGCVQRRAEGPLYSWRQELESPGMIFAGWSASLEPPWAPRLGA